MNEAEVEGGNDAANPKEDENMPWAEFNKFYKYVKDKDKRNFLASCLMCNKTVSCSYSSKHNLRSHLEKSHKWTPEKLDKELNVTKRTKKRSAENAGLGESGSNIFKKRVTQENLDKAIDDFVICTRQAHRVVDSEYFRNLVLFGLPVGLKVPCRQTFRKHMTNHFKTMIENLKKKLSNIEYVSATADGWSKFRRGFLGVVATWLDPATMDRDFAGLALQRLRGRHTHDRIAVELAKILEEFELWPSNNNNKCKKKVPKVTTDSGSNFLKAFRIFSADQLNDAAGLERDSDSEDTDGEADADDSETPVGTVDLIDMDSVFEAAINEGISLPPHQRCGAHIMNLMGTTDAKEARDSNALYKKQFDSTETKLKEYWRRQNKSDLVADVIKESFGVKLEVPGETRWNSRFDSKKQIADLVKTDLDKFNETMEKAGLPRLAPADVKFLAEYVHVMQPVAFALDILQRDKTSYLGYLLPTVIAMEKKLNERKMLDGKPLKYCDVLARTMLNAIHRPRRFQNYLEETELYVSAALIPCFKLGWIDDANKRSETKAFILEEMKRLDDNNEDNDVQAVTPAVNGHPANANTGRGRLADLTDEEWQEADAPDDGDMETETTAEEDFFGFARVSSMCSSVGEEESAEEELNRYLLKVDRSWTVQDCYALKGKKREFPRLAQLFLKFNTALPSSALVERFFSRAGLSFQAIRNMLGDNTLQEEVMLSMNKKYW